METLAVLILTHNEEQNIGKCLRSVRPLTDRVFVVDSGSEDATVVLCRSLGAQVAQRPFTTHAEQFNWGLDHFAFGTDWIMRMDADEELTPDLVAALRQFLADPDPAVTGVCVRRRVYFLGRWIRHGGYYPTWLLRVFRRGVGRCEATWMDEHIVLERGHALRIAQDIIDHNNKDLSFWTDKHNRYASREVLDVAERRGAGDASRRLAPALTGGQAAQRRWAKERVYGRVPLFVRPFLYFLYRYFLRLGFLDGREGLIFHFLQGFWYRFLVDAKLFERERLERLREGGGTP